MLDYSHPFRLSHFINFCLYPHFPESVVDMADIVFLLDESDGMRQSERQVVDFLKEFVTEMEIGPEKVQIALVQYSAEPTTVFRLNTHAQKNDVLGHLSRIQLTGGQSVRTGAALEYVKNNVFAASAGSRAQQAVPQILIHLSGKKSEDDVLNAVNRLRTAGIILHSVGVKNADRLEMEQVAHSPTAKYFIQENSDFPLVREQLISVIASQTDVINPVVGEYKSPLRCCFTTEYVSVKYTIFKLQFKLR